MLLLDDDAEILSNALHAPKPMTAAATAAPPTRRVRRSTETPVPRSEEAR
jgi:hypothetical protein